MAFLFHFWRMKVCFNGEFFPSGQPLFTAQNRGFKWGDGLFETMKVFRGRVLLEDLHFERLFISLQLLQIEKDKEFTKAILTEDILQLCRQNNCLQNARIRFAVYRKDDNTTGYTIEALPLDEAVNEWPVEGLTICLYPYARKATDAFANIKSANFLPYVLAQKYAEEKGADDAMVLNAHNYLCDTSRANIFLVKDDEIYTPALHQGCINGVMRRRTIDVVKKLGFRLHQKEISEDQLLQADEVFLTNAIQVIRWVKQYRQSEYGYQQTKKIFEALQRACLEK